MLKKLSISWSWPSWLKSAARRAAAIAPPVFLALSLLAACALSWNRTFEIYELQAYDWRCQRAAGRAVQSPVLIVEIALDALQNIGRWPFDRQYHAILIDALKAGGAKSLGVDILFVEPSGSDDALANSASDYGRVFFSEALHTPQQHRGRSETSGVMESLLPSLANASAGIGHVNAIVDLDGKRRRVAPVIWDQGKPRFQLGLLLAMDYLGVKEEDVRFKPGWILLGDKARVPVDEKGETLLRFHGRWEKSFEHISYLDILSAYHHQILGQPGPIDLKVLKDRVCVVGLTATGTHDVNPIPLDTQYPLVGTYADIFQNVIQSDFMVRWPRWLNLLAAIVLGLAGWSLSRMRSLALGAGTSVAVWALFLASNTALFVWGGWWADLFYPTLLYWAIYLSSIVGRTMQEKRKRELLEAELSIASKIQRSFLPSSLPEVEGYEMGVYMRPAKHVGGDLYSALMLDHGHLGLMCGDVSGKGMPAALFMARSVAEFKFCAAATGLDPAATLNRLNNGISEGDSSGLFVTMNYAVVDLKGRRFLLSNGGHMPVLRVRADGSSDQLSPDGGMPIGLVGDVDFCTLETALAPGDVLLMYSDGISEARNHKREDFEMERMTAAALQYRKLTAPEICTKIVELVDRFAAGMPQHDDMTLFVFKVRD